jgi:glycerophosphoryl diester phosphodiesterase
VGSERQANRLRAELRTLRAIERLPLLRPANTRYDGRYQVPTFDEILALIRAESRRLGRPIGVYPELKNPSYAASIGLPMEPSLAAALERHEALLPGAPVYVQSFEPSCLRRLSTMVRAPLVQLVDAAGADHLARDARGCTDLVTPLGLREVSTYAAAVGVHKELLWPRDGDGRPESPTGVVDEAHRAGLRVHAWTFRSENRFLPTHLRTGSRPGALGQARAEYEAHLDLGVDGVFTDHPDTAATAVAARRSGGRRLSLVDSARP